MDMYEKYWELRDAMSKTILEDLCEIEVEYNGVERKAIALVSYQGGKRHIVELDGKWAIVEDEKIIAMVSPLDMIALSRVDECIPEYNHKLKLYKKIKAQLKDEE